MMAEEKIDEKVPVVEINLEKIYKLGPQTSAATILAKILENYSFAKVVAMVNLSPDAGIEIRCNDDQLRDVIDKVIDESIDEHGGDVYTDDIAQRAAQVTNADMIVYLFDGYEEAFALVNIEDC